MWRGYRFLCTLGASALGASALSLALLAQPAHAQPDGGFRALSSDEQEALVNDKAYVPQGLGINTTYVQDFPAPGLEILLCYDADFKPLALPKTPGTWMAMEGTGGVGYGVYVFQLPNAKAAKAAGRSILATSCATRGKDSRAGLVQSQTKLPRKQGSPGLSITTSYFDDGELETSERVFRQIGLAILQVSATYNGGPDSAMAQRVRPTLTKALDRLTANYVKAAKQ